MVTKPFGVPGHLGPHVIYRWNRLDPGTRARPAHLARARARREKLIFWPQIPTCGVSLEPG